MKRSSKIALNIVLIVLLLAYAVAASVLYNNNEKRCSNFVVNILDSNIKFVTSDIIVQIIDSAKVNPVNKLRSNINVYNIEKVIKSNPYVDSVEVFTDMDGNCIAQIVQKKPFLRLANNKGSNVYLTKNLDLLEPVSHFNMDVDVINGNFDLEIDSTFFINSQKKDRNIELNLKKLINFVQIVHNNEFVDNLIVQIWVDSSWNVELVPNMGEQVIQFGKMYDCLEKVEKIELFYKKTFNRNWWQTAKEVDVKFKNQIIIRE